MPGHFSLFDGASDQAHSLCGIHFIIFKMLFIFIYFVINISIFFTAINDPKMKIFVIKYLVVVFDYRITFVSKNSIQSHM